MSDFVGYEGHASAAAIHVKVAVIVDTPVLKRELLYDIIEELKERRTPPNCKDLFLETMRFVIEQFGAARLRAQRDPPEYEAVAGGSEYVLRLLHNTWTSFFPEGSPAKLNFDITISLTAEDMVWALGYARTHGCLYLDELDVPDLDAEQTLYSALYTYVDAGETYLEEFTEMPPDVHDMCEAAVQKHFGFLNAKHKFGAWGELWATER